MQIQFDPRDRNACTAVLVAIAALHPDLTVAADFHIGGGTPSPAPAFDGQADAVDASEAFDAPDPAAAFPPAAAAPIAPPAMSAPLPPAGTQGDGTAATTPPAGADNGQAAAPTASPSSAAPAGVELDAKGLPWDGRIHAGKASAPIKVGDGSWRKKRGVDAALVTQVEAELRQVMAAPGPNAAPPANAAGSSEPAPAPAPTVAPAAPTPTPPAAGMEHGAVAATTAPSAPPAPPVAAPPVAAAVPIAEQSPAAPPVAEAGPLTLPVLMRKITALQTAGTLDVAGTNAIAVSLGLTSVRDLVQRPDLIATFDALLPEQVA